MPRRSSYTVRIPRSDLISFVALLPVLLGPFNVIAQEIDTYQRPVNVALNADTDTNGNLWNANWWTDILVDGAQNVIHGDGAQGVTGFPEDPGFYYQIDLGETFPIDSIDLLTRQDGCCPDRLRDFRVSLLSESKDEVWGVDLYPDEDAPGVTRISLTETDGVGSFVGRYVQVTTLQDPVDDYELQLSEIEVYSGFEEAPLNYALNAPGETNGSLYGVGWDSLTALTDGNVFSMVHGDGAGGVQGIAEDPGFFYQIDLGQVIDMASINVWPRQDGCCPDRLTNYRVSVHEDDNGSIGEQVWAADYRTDFSTPDVGPTDPDLVIGDDDPSGIFQGQWVRVMSLDDPIADYALQIAEIEVFGTKGEGLIGDFDGSGVLDAADIDLLSEAVRQMSTDSQFDLDGDGSVRDADRVYWIGTLKNTYLGDSNLDGEFNSSDFVSVFQAGEFEDEVPGNSTWGTGDWNGDADFGTSDFVVAFQEGGFEMGPRQGVAAVPEPATSSLIAISLSLLLGAYGRSSRRIV